MSLRKSMVGKLWLIGTYLTFLFCTYLQAVYKLTGNWIQSFPCSLARSPQDVGLGYSTKQAKKSCQGESESRMGGGGDEVQD